MVDIAVDDSNAALYETLGQQLEAKDEQNRILTTKTIELDSNLQEALNRVEALVEERDEAKGKGEMLQAAIDSYENQVRELSDKLADKNREIDGLNDVIGVKDGEINELRNQLNRAPAPRAGFMDVTPSSARLAELQDEASKKIMSRLDLVLAGQTTRGTVMILGADEKPLTPPPLFDGGSESQESFRHEDTEGDAGHGGIPVAEETVSQFPEGEDIGMATDTAVRESDAEALTLEQRVARLEETVYGQKVKVTEAAA